MLDVGPVPPALRSAARNVVARLPAVGELLRQRDQARAERDALRAEVERLRALEASVDGRQFVPPGHFYSAIPSQRFVREHEATLYGPPPRTLPGVDVREEAQLALLETLRPLLADTPFPAERGPSCRYWFENPAYSYSDALFLQAMLRHLRPRRVLEVGSGYSSCVTLDVRERYLGGATECTFVEPYPELLLSLLRKGDLATITLLPAPVQEVPLARFEALEANDVLFIDSTHVSKIGSDVNHLVFEVLPRLAPGVHVHFHDVFFPFEYPLEWVREGRSWTEDYLLRAFLMFNGAFELVLCNTFLQHFHHAWFQAHAPLCLKNRGGHLWLRRTR